MEVTQISHRIIADLLLERTGQQLTEGRQWRVGSALTDVFREYGIDNVDQLVCMLDRNDSEEISRKVVEALLNNETYFFRDRQLFQRLSDTVLPDLAAKRAGTRRLAIWSVGCSTGQEALSLSMMFADRPQMWRGWKIEILGTDISSRAISAARRACYSQFEIQRGLGVAQMLRHFSETPRGWVPDPALLAPICYRVGNVLDTPIRPERFDLVLCRNVLLYFDTATRRRALGRVADSLRSDGWLMLGAGETMAGNSGRFAPATDVQGLYRCTGREPADRGLRGSSCKVNSHLTLP
ncbi:CheR family methyltransferase [Pelagerythrobacter rhizovicinus]|uniref:Protein-glutamate O-methyltransferase CheR n=1 Tax=Pelagerythrobacter rhizovicinus TaxID=2268576 RepID=A0A4V1QVX4_9SPHN|nr:protein-glutamate O-methyltransferase CheR [Pelagerythrobacter rhizovicinus]RXZ64166.1 protein-glutamate O-methyltransferase CheR [Pelagerythrobacter rhizovicinus]